MTIDWSKLAELSVEGLDRTLCVRLEEDVELGDLALARRREQPGKGGRALRDVLGLALVMLALGGDLAGLALVLERTELVSGIGNRLPAQDLNRLAGTGLLDALTVLVEHRSHAAPCGACKDGITFVQGAAVNQDGGNRAPALVEMSLDHDPALPAPRHSP